MNCPLCKTKMELKREMNYPDNIDESEGENHWWECPKCGEVQEVYYGDD